MNFNIEVLNLTRETKTTAKGGSYVQLEVAYKNLTNGKVEGKKLFSFSKPDKVYKTLNDAHAGNNFSITSEKGEKYWEWTDIVVVAPPQPGEPVMVKSTAVASPKSTYETPEERAKRQVLIVKQSSIGSAIELLSVGAKSPPSVQSVLDVAQQLTDWVFASGETKVPSLMEMPNDNFDIS